MYYYIKEHTKEIDKPYELLSQAKEYIRKRGHEDAHINEMVDKRFAEKWQKHEEAKSTTTASTPAITTTATQEQTTVTKLPVTATTTTSEVSVENRYVPTKAAPEDWYERLAKGHNEHEKTLRGLRGDMSAIKTAVESLTKTQIRPKPFTSTPKEKTGGFVPKGRGRGKFPKDGKGRGRGRGRASTEWQTSITTPGGVEIQSWKSESGEVQEEIENYENEETEEAQEEEAEVQE